jgi:hypothetical protein
MAIPMARFCARDGIIIAPQNCTARSPHENASKRQKWRRDSPLERTQNFLQPCAVADNLLYSVELFGALTFSTPV